jgi:DNA-directed RNA polymerase specialized sigma24 family protein
VVATRRRGRRRPAADVETLLAPLRAQEPKVVHALWQRYSSLVLPLLHCAFRGNQAAVDEAVLDVFLQVFRWGPTLPRRADLHTFVMRAVTRTVKRLSTARRSV